MGMSIISEKLEYIRNYLDVEVHPVVSPDRWDVYCALCDMVDDIIALLKAQEPVRPIIEKNISTGECEDPWGRLFFCGACGKRINEKYNPDEDDKYCKHCGRAVKWE